MPVATNTASAPRPTQRDHGAVRPASTAATPSTPKTLPRSRAGVATSPSGLRCRSTSAATGGIRTARRAGTIAETTVTPTPTSDRDDRRAGLEHQRRGRQRDAERLQQRLEAERGEDAEPQTDQRGDQPGQRGLAQHRPEDLAAAGADDAQQRQLSGPLTDGDRERVEDREGADEQRDEGEDQQRRGDERERRC